MVINSIQIDNFRCFESETIRLSVPNGEPGSGLNILIGENGTGKTTVLESINYITQSTFAAESRLSIQDFHDPRSRILITATTDQFSCKMGAPHFGQTFLSDGVRFSAASRTRKSSGKLLSSPFQVSSRFRPVGKTYLTKDGRDSGKDIPALQMMFSNNSIDQDGLNIFYFDKNRGRQISSGTYKTTFERICDDLNWKFLKALDQEAEQQLVESSTTYSDGIIAMAQKHLGERLAAQVTEFFGNTLYDNLRIEIADTLNPFRNAFFAIREPDSLMQIPVKGLGSGVEMIITLLLLLDLARDSSSDLVILIDEPELHLHPRAQKDLLELLLRESTQNQIVVSTHSPYLFRGLPGTAAMFVFRQSADQHIDIESTQEANWGHLPWSPSWGEVNFFAYDLPTVEFHNELYGLLQERTGAQSEKDLEDLLLSMSVPQSKEWRRSDRNGAPYSVTLQTYIRNSIHHPENKLNPAFSETELRSSIETLIRLIEGASAKPSAPDALP